MRNLHSPSLIFLGVVGENSFLFFSECIFHWSLLQSVELWFCQETASTSAFLCDFSQNNLMIFYNAYVNVIDAKSLWMHRGIED